MCGIVAASARRDVGDILISGLRALEYRGYDSAGLAIHAEGSLFRVRTPGKVREVAALWEQEGRDGHCGIAHTRWATHGVPNEKNAHPHMSGNGLALVHNGIIENHAELREELRGQGFEFQSDTDTEVMVHLIQSLLDKDAPDLFAAVQLACRRLEGAFAIAVTATAEEDTVVGARKGSPLVLGLGFGEHFLASDVHALLPVTNRFIYLEEGDVVEIRPDAYRLHDAEGQPREGQVRETDLTADAVSRGRYRHYMQKEIFEQPKAVADTLEGRVWHGEIMPNLFGQDADALLAGVRQVHIVACGTSYHAGLVARYQIEQLAGLPCSVEVASEYRYRQPVVPPETLFVAISQSGETLDTLSALRHAKEAGYLASLAICNVPESSLVREADLSFLTRAGPEIGVASTKAFTTQLVALHLLVLTLARHQGLPDEAFHQRVAELEHLPAVLNQVLELDGELKRVAEDFADKHHALYLGRGSHYPIALEGALKLKEISYIHAEAYPAGELKHGPLALVDEDMPVVAVAPNNALLEKLLSNLEEVRARGGHLVVIADRKISGSLAERPGTLVAVPTGGDLLAPVVLTLPLQMLAYHVAILKGTDVDQPRNLAKSVTVE